MSGRTHPDPPAFPRAAAPAVRDARLRGNLRRATGTIRAKRAQAVAELDDWEELPHRQSKIRLTAMSDRARTVGP